MDDQIFFEGLEIAIVMNTRGEVSDNAGCTCAQRLKLNAVGDIRRFAVVCLMKHGMSIGISRGERFDGHG